MQWIPPHPVRSERPVGVLLPKWRPPHRCNSLAHTPTRSARASIENGSRCTTLCRSPPQWGALRFGVEVAIVKRADGALEHDILDVLWASAEPLLPAEIKGSLRYDLAYTSVATVLGRLHAKGLVERRMAGRAFTYQATLTESELASRRMNEVLSGTSDRSAALAGFAGSLSKRDAKALRAVLNTHGR